MKVSECDFCQIESKHLHPVNEDLWAICDACFDLHYRILPRHLELKEKGPCHCDGGTWRRPGCCLLVVGSKGEEE